jgi:hypothetical protein
MKKTVAFLFLTHFTTRILYCFIIGFYSNCVLTSDCVYLLRFSDKIQEVDFNFDIGRFISSPLFPTICGVFKLMFSHVWDTALVLFQLVLSSLSGVFIYKIALLIFNDRRIALLASLVFAVFPMTIWFVNTFSQECLFQSFLIFTIYYLLLSCKESSIKNVVFSASFFSLTYLTKSHILLFSLFIPFIYFHYFKTLKRAFIFTAVFAAISLFFSLPYGLYHYKKNGIYVISSNGFGYQFYLGNTEVGYKATVDIPKKNSADFAKILDVNNTAGYFNGSDERYKSILALPQKAKQTLFLGQAIDWIKANPMKFTVLKLYDTFFFLCPGVNFKYYNFKEWLFSFLLSMPIYLCAYISMFHYCRNNFQVHSFMFYLFLVMLLFSTILYVQNRFRTVTIEPFYIVYAAPIFYKLIEKVPIFNKIYTQVNTFFHKTTKLSVS